MRAQPPLVSVVVPTYNCARTLRLCLQSVLQQDYPSLELLVVDSYSRDGTVDVAREMGARVLFCQGRLLAARTLGARESKGEFVLMLDADQVLKPGAISRAVEMMQQGYDMLVLEEESYNRQWVVPRLYAASKAIVNARFRTEEGFDPARGGNPPRFFRRELLLRALEAIPPHVVPDILHYDHDIIYYECRRLSQRVGLLREAVWHIEPDLGKLLRTNLRYGASLRAVKATPYWDLFLREREGSLWFGRPWREGLLALALHLLLKGTQWVGYRYAGLREAWERLRGRFSVSRRAHHA
ncbi:MAG TPA: glycosyltransferase family 2 protein [Dehalococcoidia bacterium]|nr:glycosyltransferase family 2 protein [Dehalococcoidia bacterium]